MKYITPQEIWNALGKGAFNKVRGEVLLTGSGAFVTVTTSQENIISGSEKIYENNSIFSNYLMDYDDGLISLTASSGKTYIADYNYAQLSNTYITSLIEQSEEELELITGRKFDVNTTSEYITVEKEYYPKIFILSNYPVNSIISVSGNTNTLQEPIWETLNYTSSDNYLYFDETPPAIQLKVDYVYGYSSIPNLVKELAVCLCIKKMINTGVYKSIVSGDFSNETALSELDNRIEKLKNLLGKISIEKI